jgi:hypothetical protein
MVIKLHGTPDGVLLHSGGAFQFEPAIGNGFVIADEAMKMMIDALIGVKAAENGIIKGYWQHGWWVAYYGTHAAALVVNHNGTVYTVAEVFSSEHIARLRIPIEAILALRGVK